MVLPSLETPLTHAIDYYYFVLSSSYVSLPLSRIEYTETFNNLLNDLIDHLSPYSSEEQVIIHIADFIERLESLVSFTSTAAPISQPLLELGVRTFREFTADDFRLLYRIKEEKNSVRIIGDVIISQKQDIQQLLINYCLLHK